MKSNCSFVLCVCLLAGCGGSGGDHKNSVEGLWKGDVYQGVIECSNGAVIPVGSSSVIRDVVLDVVGGDDENSPVQATFDKCVLDGVRDSQGFRADAVSGCDQGFSSVQFILQEDGSAKVNFIHDINKVPESDGGVRCKAAPWAQLQRE